MAAEIEWAKARGIGPAHYEAEAARCGRKPPVTLSVLGATVLYVVSMVSLFVLRRRAPDMTRPFVAPVYPYFPLPTDECVPRSLGGEGPG